MANCFTTTPTIPESYAAGGFTTIQDAITELAKCCIVTGVANGLAESSIMSTHFPDGKPDKCMFLTAVRVNGETLWTFDSGANWLIIYEGQGAQTGLQTATITQWAGDIDDLISTWLPCDGREVSRVTYADLFAIIETDYGVGDGSTTFNLPDLRGRVPVGANYGDLPNGNDGAYTTRNLGDELGTETHVLLEAEMAGHNHANTAADDTNGRTAALDTMATGSASATSSTGGDTAHNNIQPSAAMYYAIRI